MKACVDAIVKVEGSCTDWNFQKELVAKKLVVVDLIYSYRICLIFFFFQAEDGIRDVAVTGVQTCALPISRRDRFGEAVGEILVFGRTKVLEREYHQHLVARGRPGVAAGQQFRPQAMGERDRKSVV